MNFGTIVMRPMVIVSRGYDLAPLDKYGTQGEAHGTLRCSLRTLRQVKIGLVHFDCKLINFSSSIETKMVVVEEKKSHYHHEV